MRRIEASQRNFSTIKFTRVLIGCEKTEIKRKVTRDDVMRKTQDYVTEAFIVSGV